MASLDKMPWIERLWRNSYSVDVSRGNVMGAKQYHTFGELITEGAVNEIVVWEEGMMDNLNVPDSIQMSVQSTSASDTGQLTIKYLDGNLVEREETLTLTGTTPVLTTATDIMAINNAYKSDGVEAVGNITATNGGLVYMSIPAGSVQFNTSMQRVPAGKVLMINTVFAGSRSGTSAAKTRVKLQSTQINGDSFADSGVLFPIIALSLQDNSTSIPDFPPYKIQAGEWVGFTTTTDKAADIIAGLIGWLENQ